MEKLDNRNAHGTNLIEKEETLGNKNKKSEKESLLEIIKKVKIFLKQKKDEKRESLKKNKIFYEVFSYLFVGIMGIVLSFVGWKTNERSADIYQKQLEIMKNDREPYFTLKSEEIYEEVEETEEDDTIAIRRYIISNNGGTIRDVSIIKDASAIISVPKNEDNITEGYYVFKYSFLDFFFNKLGIKPQIQHVEDGKDIIFYEYGIERKHPDYIDDEEFDYSDIFWMLEEKLEEKLNCALLYERKNFIEITYTNYKNEKYTKRFEFTNDNMWLSNEDEEGIDLHYNVSQDIDNMAEEIKEGIEGWIIENEEKNMKDEDETNKSYGGGSSIH